MFKTYSFLYNFATKYTLQNEKDQGIYCSQLKLEMSLFKLRDSRNGTRLVVQCNKDSWF